MYEDFDESVEVPNAPEIDTPSSDSGSPVPPWTRKTSAATATKQTGQMESPEQGPSRSELSEKPSKRHTRSC